MSKRPIIGRDYHLHYFGEEGYLYDVNSRNINKIDLDYVSTDILELCDGRASYDEILIKLGSLYGFNETDIEEVDSFRIFMNNLFTSGVLTENDTKEGNRFVSGVRNKFYPYFISMEITNSCNLKCAHCFKKASSIGASFLDFSNIVNILDNFKYKTPILNVTGGEPLMHPEINEILSYSIKNFKTSLLTNLICLDKLDLNLVNQLRTVQTTIYGVDDNEYFTNTGIKNGYNTFCNNLMKLISHDVDTICTIIINRKNLYNLVEYLKVLDALGVKNVSFGLALPFGRLENSTLYKDEWLLNADEIMDVKKITTDLYNMYRGRIRMKPIQDDAFSIERSGTKDGLNCMAGKTNVAISETGRVRPCNMLAETFFSMGNVDEYINRIENGLNYCFKESVKKYKRHLVDCGLKPSQIFCGGC